VARTTQRWPLRPWRSQLKRAKSDIGRDTDLVGDFSCGLLCPLNQLLVRHRDFTRQLLAPCIDPQHHDNHRAHAIAKPRRQSIMLSASLRPA
jgi:hypothetical protein